MKDKKIIIQIPFSAFHKEREVKAEWNRARLRVFADYTLKSLKAQTNQDFVVLIKCRDIMKDFITEEANKLASIPDNIRFVGFSKEYLIRVNELITGYKYFYEVRLDSDDMYCRTYIDFLHKYNPKEETEALINQKGYLYDSISKRIALYGYTSPPYYTLIYKVEDYLRGFRYTLKRGHGSAIFLKHEILKDGNFIGVMHKINDSSSFEYLDRFVGKSKEKEREDILKEFGIKENDNGEN